MKFLRSVAWRFAVAAVLLAGWILQPVGVNPPAGIDTDFEEARARGHLEAMLSDGRPHPLDSDANDLVRDRLVNEIETLGFEPMLRDQFHCNDYWDGSAICARVQNIAFWVNAPGNDAVLVMAHHDSVAAGPGAGDDGIGVASALEIARVLRDEELARPVLILLTDGEEDGLVGAAAFATTDPLAKMIGAVVNLEARTVSGAVSVLQTSLPNANDLAALRLGGRGGVIPPANSIDTDLSEVIPGDMDFSMLLPLGVDGLNYILLGSAVRYHTPLDSLSSYDPRSAQHLGASALAGVRGFANIADRAPQESERATVFANIGSWGILSVPVPMAGAIVALGLVAAIIIFFQLGGGAPVRSAIAPLIAALFGAGAAIGVTALVAALRPEDAFASATPMALRSLQALAALTVASLVVAMFRIENAMRLAAGAWLWLSAIIFAVFFLFPGASTLLLPGAAVMGIAAVLTFVKPLRRLAPLFVFAAAAVFAGMAFPFAAAGEHGIGVEGNAPFALLLAFAYLVFAPAGAAGRWTPPLVLAALTLPAFAAALFLPAYSVEAPQHLTVVHRDWEGKGNILIDATGPLPAAMQALAAFQPRPDSAGRWRAPAPAIDMQAEVAIDVTRNEAGGKTISIVIDAPLSDRHEFGIDEGLPVSAVTINGAKPKMTGEELRFIRCSGRACRRMEIVIEIDATGDLPALRWVQQRYGSGAFAAPLVNARPANAQPLRLGDRREIVRILEL